MRFLSVADRELRAAARQKATYRTRWLTAVVFFALLVWLLWAFHGFTRRGTAPVIFQVYSVLAFVYCLIIGTTQTADCLSSERREGTLGLLFLTNLNSAEIIVGKLCSTALASAYGLLSIFPMLALPLLMGGITFDYFARTLLALFNGILFSLACGFLASVLCLRQFTAIAAAIGLAAFVSGGLFLAGAAASFYAPTKSFAPWFLVLSPLYSVVAAEGRGVLGVSHYWSSLVAVAGLSLGSLGFTAFWLGRIWKDRAKITRAIVGLKSWGESRGWASRRAALRHRLLEINPFFWLGGRRPVSAPVFMLVTLVLVAITSYVLGPFFGRVMRAGTYSLVVGQLFAWFWATVAIHSLVLYYAAMTSSQRLAEDKQTGALELILSTPLSERTMSLGLWMAYGRRMLFPALAAVLAHIFFIWAALIMATLDPPGQIPRDASPGEIFWSALLGQSIRGFALDWHFGFMLRIVLLVLLVLITSWVTLGWVGRWLGLRMRRPGFAPMMSLVLLTVPPVLIFSLACYLADEFNLDRLPERHFLPAMMWLGFAIGIGHCVLLSAWCATRLRNDLRAVAMSRYQPLPAWQWRLLRGRTVRRIALGMTALAATVYLLMAGYLRYHDWRSKQAWGTFQITLKQKGETLDLASLLPGPITDEDNFARSPAFLSVLKPPTAEAKRLFGELDPLLLPGGIYGRNAAGSQWIGQLPLLLTDYVGWMAKDPSRAAKRERNEQAMAILEGLQSQKEILQDLAAATVRYPKFQAWTNRNANSVLRPPQAESSALERLHLLLETRACASVAIGQADAAAEDLLTCLRLAHLARQIPDGRSALRAQLLLMRSLQPLWEGLREHAWNQPQLDAFQKELAGFDLFADYTNAVRRVVLANIEDWRAIPERQHALPVASGEMGVNRPPPTRLFPATWWYNNCIQLYQAGLNAIARVDMATGRFQPAVNWSDFNGLPLESATAELLQQHVWLGANPGSVAFAQTSLSQALIACALERFWLRRTAFPASLDALVPTLIDRVPRDAVSGRPIIYQLKDDGSYILRGVGPNGLDDRKKQSSDDWIWAYSTNAPPAGK